MVVTGDVTQIDLPTGRSSGLNQAANVLRDVKGIGIVRFTEGDVVRHELVAEIVRGHEEFESSKSKKVSRAGGRKMIISLENDQDIVEIPEKLEQLLSDGLNAVAKLHGLGEHEEVDITIVSDEEITP